MLGGDDVTVAKILCLTCRTSAGDPCVLRCQNMLTLGGEAGAVLGGDEAAVGQLLQLVPRPRQVPHKVPVEARLLPPDIATKPMDWSSQTSVG